ncbi:hypothetical protein FDP41_010614 [Naegleria fowleri]|uniref:Protein YIPF n=1 Tax=Naegleria fowleri TaxID=5763 RepID=A0A6A5CE23_NAEFO|nr:uncharacterized protein FDP41_010614 [Naegleria fowleri]KAF0983549.1 hypothetical protein FDP41_010614 [Naegleria fowleri]CAG4718172.1 unnamed protein product [Naegleria fowleri]
MQPQSSTSDPFALQHDDDPFATSAISELERQNNPLLENQSPSGSTNNNANINKDDYDDTSDTIDEPIYKTIMRDLTNIGRKIALVLVPVRDEQKIQRELRNWDLWGPLLLCIVLAFTLGFSAKETQKGAVFGGVFVIIWLGSGIVTLNGQLLGGTISFFQSVCVLGYCVFPLVLCSVAFIFLESFTIRFFVVLCCVIWCCITSTLVLTHSVKPKRKLLSMYPVILYYIFIGWLVFVQ